jgi:hypothetical protein
METQVIKTYSISKEHCQRMIVPDSVCSQCGGLVEPIETIDNANHPTYWAGCNTCCRFDWGVSQLVFSIAKEMVDNRNHIAYSYLGVKHNHPEAEWPEWYKSQYSGTCRMVRDVLDIHSKLILEKVNK